MRLLLVIFAVFLVSAAAADPSLSLLMPSFDVSPFVDWDGTECNEASAGAHVCNYNCTKVLLCRGDADPIEIATCEYPFGCANGECVNGSSTCEDKSILCTGRGLFPDPYDCTKYHICKNENDNSRPHTCDHGWAYDPLTGVCSKQLTDNICTDLPIVCNEIGDSNTFPGNPSIYYVCVSDKDGKMYPTMYRCIHGGIYNPETFLCSDGPAASSSAKTSSVASTRSTTSHGTPSVKPSSSTSQSIKTSTSSSTSIPPSEGGACPTPGALVPDPGDCLRYYQCLPSNKWKRINCIHDFYFDREKEKCVYGTCPYSAW